MVMLELFNGKYPYTDFHELNLDWIISKLIQMDSKLTNFVNLNTIKYADPISWDITKQYETNTIVIDQTTGVAYISAKPVPAGVAISNTDYWSVVFDLQQIINNITDNLTFHNNGASPTLLGDVSIGDWILWNNKLYVALYDMIAGTALIEGSNIEMSSVEYLTKTYTDYAKNEIETIIGMLSDLTTTDKTSIVNAINELVSSVAAVVLIIGALSDLTTTDKTSIVNAINELVSSIAAVVLTIGALSDLTTADKTSIVNAINELVSNMGDLNDLTTSDKSSLVNAINLVNTRASTIISMIGSLSNLTTADKTSIVNAINEVNAKTTMNPRYLFITDSYGGHPDQNSSWIDYVVTFMGITNYIDLWEGGAAFTQTDSNYHSFLEVVQNAVISTPETITDIVLVGGYNDAPSVWGHVAQLPQAISTFVSYCKGRFTNAKVHIGMCGRNSKNSQILSELSDVAYYYKRCVSYGASYISGVENALHKDTYIKSDGIHPTDAGSQSIARAVANYLTTGYGEVDIVFGSITTTPTTGVSLTSWFMQSSTKNDVTSVFFNCWPNNYMLINFTTPKTIQANGADIITIGSMENTCITGGYHERSRVNCTCIVSDQNGTNRTLSCAFEFVNKTIIIRIYYPTALSNITAVYVPPFTATFPSAEC